MAIVKLTDTWILDGYANILANNKRDEPIWSTPLPGLRHFAFPQVRWKLGLFPRGDSNAEPNYASVHVWAGFAPGAPSQHALAEVTVSVIGGQAEANLKALTAPLRNFVPHRSELDFASAFPQERLKRAARLNGGKLGLKLELTIFRIEDLLKCRQTVGALLCDFAHMDGVFTIGQVVVRAHKALLASRCPTLENFHPDNIRNILSHTTADIFTFFLFALYFSFDFLRDWRQTLGVLKLARLFDATNVKLGCENALAELIPRLSLADVLQILPEAIRCDAGVVKLACLRLFRQRQKFLSSAEWIAFKATQPREVLGAICDDWVQEDASCDSPSPVRASRVKLSHTWEVSGAPERFDQDALTSPWSLWHTAFPGLSGGFELYPRGNSQDPRHMPGFASLYLKVTPESNDAGSEVIFVNWKASITRNGQTAFVPTIWDDMLYSGAKEMKFGCANAFRFEDSDAPNLPLNQSLQIRWEVTIEPVGEILESLDVFRSLHADPKFADVEIDINGTIFQAHKFILSRRSAVLAAELAPHAQENTMSRITIDDTTPAAFQRFLSAVYFVSWDFLSDANATKDVLRLAEKYAVADLKRYCDEALMHFAFAASASAIEQNIECDDLIDFKEPFNMVLIKHADGIVGSDRLSLKRKCEEPEYVSPISSLSDEDLAAIFERLPAYERLIVSEVCRHWLELSRKAWTDVASINLGPIPGEHIGAIIKQCPNLRRVIAVRKSFGLKELVVLTKAANLISLKFYACDFALGDEPPDVFERIFSSRAAQALWTELVLCDSTFSLSTEESDDLEFDVEHLPASLKRLQVSGLRRTTDLGHYCNTIFLDELQRLENLECLILHNMPERTNDHDYLAEEEDMLDSLMGDVDVVERVCRLKNLKELCVSSANEYGGDVDEPEFGRLCSGLPKLEVLFLNDFNGDIAGDDLAKLITSAPALRILVLTGGFLVNGAPLVLPARERFPNGFGFEPLPLLHIFVGKEASENIRFEKSESDAAIIHPISEPMPEFLEREDIAPIFEGVWMAEKIKEAARHGSQLWDYRCWDSVLFQ